ncbi:MAG: FISUMP domain-containing protein [Ignavibacteria bacterium]|nr:FISUMP domain-containing protein [Ignavibacteria bacterium]
MENKFTLRLLFIMASAALLFTTNTLSQSLPYLGQTPPGNIPVRLVPDSLAANSDWQYHGTPSFSPDGNEMYYAIYRYNPGRIEIWFTECVNGKWTSPQIAPFANNNYSNNNPYFSRNKDTLYFLSNRPNGIVFRVTRNNGVWSSPLALNINLPTGYSPGWQFSIANNGNIYAELTYTKTGAEDIYLWRFVNSQYQPAEKLSAICSPQLDFTPYIDPAERFIMFASRRPGGFGNTDIYISKKNSDNTWAIPINAGQIINSGEVIQPAFSRDGKYFFFEAWMPNALGGNPYWVDANVIYNLINDTTVTDADGNIYKTIKIGDQIWMAENLRTTKYNDGVEIPNVVNDKAWGNLKTPGYCWGNYNTTNRNLFGIWYNWYAVNTKKLAPTGWHIPTAAEWKTLQAFLGGESIAGGKMKVKGTAYWFSPNIGATNESGFSAYPVGYRNYDGVDFNMPGDLASFWASDEFDASDAIGTRLTADREDFRVFEFGVSKTYGYSIRCVKNDPSTSVVKELFNPTGFNLFQNYPNPFNPTTTIKYEIKTQSYVKLNITNVLGEIVFDAINEMKAAGVHEYNFNAANLSSGIYFYQLVAGNHREIKKMILLR